jgi:hypothetical protein
MRGHVGLMGNKYEVSVDKPDGTLESGIADVDGRGISIGSLINTISRLQIYWTF